MTVVGNRHLDHGLAQTLTYTDRMKTPEFDDDR